MLSVDPLCSLQIPQAISSCCTQKNTMYSATRQMIVLTVHLSANSWQCGSTEDLEKIYIAGERSIYSNRINLINPPDHNGSLAGESRGNIDCSIMLSDMKAEKTNNPNP